MSDKIIKQINYEDIKIGIGHPIIIGIQQDQQIIYIEREHLPELIKILQINDSDVL